MPAEFPVPEAAAEAVNDKLWPLPDGYSTLIPHRKHNYEQGCAVCEEDVPAVLAVAAPHIAAAAIDWAADRADADGCTLRSDPDRRARHSGMTDCGECHGEVTADFLRDLARQLREEAQ